LQNKEERRKREKKKRKGMKEEECHSHSRVFDVDALVFGYFIIILF